MAARKRTNNHITGNVGQAIFGDHAHAEQHNYGDAGDERLNRAMSRLWRSIDDADDLHDKAELQATMRQVKDELRPGGDRRRAVELLGVLLTKTAEVATVSAAVVAVLELVRVT